MKWGFIRGQINLEGGSPIISGGENSFGVITLLGFTLILQGVIIE